MAKLLILRLKGVISAFKKYSFTPVNFTFLP